MEGDGLVDLHCNKQTPIDKHREKKLVLLGDVLVTWLNEQVDGLGLLIKIWRLPSQKVGAAVRTSYDARPCSCTRH
jgi:hypothetical protein